MFIIDITLLIPVKSLQMDIVTVLQKTAPSESKCLTFTSLKTFFGFGRLWKLVVFGFMFKYFIQRNLIVCINHVSKSVSWRLRGHSRAFLIQSARQDSERKWREFLRYVFAISFESDWDRGARIISVSSGPRIIWVGSGPRSANHFS